jgi:hypothetical protein
MTVSGVLSGAVQFNVSITILLMFQNHESITLTGRGLIYFVLMIKIAGIMDEMERSSISSMIPASSNIG